MADLDGRPAATAGLLCSLIAGPANPAVSGLTSSTSTRGPRRGDGLARALMERVVAQARCRGRAPDLASRQRRGPAAVRIDGFRTGDYLQLRRSRPKLGPASIGVGRRNRPAAGNSVTPLSVPFRIEGYPRLSAACLPLGQPAHSRSAVSNSTSITVRFSASRSRSFAFRRHGDPRHISAAGIEIVIWVIFARSRSRSMSLTRPGVRPLRAPSRRSASGHGRPCYPQRSGSRGQASGSSRGSACRSPGRVSGWSSARIGMALEGFVAAKADVRSAVGI